MSEYIFCTKCGNKCETTFNFCNKCGNKLIQINSEDIEEQEIKNTNNEGLEECQNTEVDAGTILIESNFNKIDAIKEYNKLTGIGLSEIKKIIDEASKNCSRDNKKRSALGMILNNYSATLKYYGSHPYYPKEGKLTLKLTPSVLKFSSTFGQEVITPLSDIRTVKIETEEEVIRRFTATRIALFGPFALAMKKKKVNKKKYLIIECMDFTLTLDGESFIAKQFCKQLYDNVMKSRNK